MSKILTNKQQEELNKAILQYLEPLLKEDADKGEATQESIAKLLNLDQGNAESNIIPNYLEKKWSTVLRLQRRIIDLESEVKSLKLALESAPTTASNGSIEGADSSNGSVASSKKLNWIPKTISKTLLNQASQIVTSVSIHPKLPIIFNGASDGSLIVWSMVSDNSDAGIPEKVIKAHTRGINRIEISHSEVNLSGSSTTTDAQSAFLLATCSSDLSIKIWNADTFQHIRTLVGHDHTVSSVAFSKSKPTVLYSVSRDKTIKIWDLTTGICVKSFVGHSDWVRDIDVSHPVKSSDNSAGGDFLLTCSNDQSVRLTHAESGTGLALLIGHTHVIEKVKFLPLSSNFYIDKLLKEESSKFSVIPQELYTSPLYVKTLGYKYCISAGRDNLLKLWLLPPPELRPHRDPMPSQYNNSQGWLIADLIGHSSWVKSVIIHPSGRYVFSAGDDKTIRVWDLSTLSSTGGTVSCVRTLQGHKGFINDIDFAPIQQLPEGKEQTNNKDVANDENDDEKLHEEMMNSLEGRIRCIFVSGGVDNSTLSWK